MASRSFKYATTQIPSEIPSVHEGTHSYWQLLAAKLDARPDLYAVALETCQRWLNGGHTGAHRLQQWRALIMEAQGSQTGRERVGQILRGGDGDDERLREFNPFAGILTREERRRASELCGYRH